MMRFGFRVIVRVLFQDGLSHVSLRILSNRDEKPFGILERNIHPKLKRKINYSPSKSK
jgi:hypothetical protein